jgi:hypothetical protein
MKPLGPSDALRNWFGHRSDRWSEFRERYRNELLTPLRQMLVAELQGAAWKSPVTLVYGARDREENEAVVLRQLLLQIRAFQNPTWNASMRLLVTISVTAAGHANELAPVVTWQLFASSVVTASAMHDAQQDLIAGGALRELPGGYQLTASGRRRVRQLLAAHNEGPFSSVNREPDIFPQR